MSRRQQGRHRPPRSEKASKPLVAIGYCHPESVSAFWHGSLNALLYRSKTQIGTIISVLSGPKVDEARNDIFRKWINTDATHLLMIDTDMVFGPDSLDRLIAHDKDIVGGLCFVADPHRTRVRPTIGVLTPTGDGKTTVETMWDYPVKELVQCDSTGGAFLLIKREVAETILEARGKDHVMPWFAHGVHGKVVIGEDIGFCLTARSLGFEVWVDTSLEILHVKPELVGEAAYVGSLSNESHPNYDERESVPIYQEFLSGYSSIGSDRPSSPELSVP